MPHVALQWLGTRGLLGLFLATFTTVLRAMLGFEETRRQQALPFAAGLFVIGFVSVPLNARLGRTSVSPRIRSDLAGSGRGCRSTTSTTTGSTLVPPACGSITRLRRRTIGRCSLQYRPYSTSTRAAAFRS
jgi:hypothetical protein